MQSLISLNTIHDPENKFQDHIDRYWTGKELQKFPPKLSNFPQTANNTCSNCLDDWYSQKWRVSSVHLSAWFGLLNARSGVYNESPFELHDAISERIPCAKTCSVNRRTVNELESRRCEQTFRNYLRAGVYSRSSRCIYEIIPGV